VGTAGVATLLLIVPSVVEVADPGLAVFVVIAILSEWAYVPLGRGAISLTFAVTLPAFILYGVGGAVLCETLGYIVGHALFDTRDWRVKFFNVAQYVLTCAAAGYAFLLVSGEPRLVLTSSDILGLAAFTLVYFVVNHVLVGIWLSLVHPDESRQVIWFEPAKWEGFTYLITTPLGVAVIMLYAEGGLSGAAALFVVLLAAAFILRLTLKLDLVNRELKTLYESAEALAQGLDLDSIQAKVLKHLAKLASYDCATLFLWDGVGQVLRCTGSLPGSAGITGQTLRLGEGVIGRALERRKVEVLDLPAGRKDRGKPEALPAGEAPAEAAAATDEAGAEGDQCSPQFPTTVNSVLVAPMVVQDNLVGVLVLASTRQGCYTEEHQRLLTIFAGQAGAALRRAVRYQEARQMAITDSKTGVYNYRFFYERLVDEMRRHEAADKPLSIIFIDLDHLKEINDRYGHQVGDDVVVQVAALISCSIRETDEVARYGGEEFVVLLPGASGEVALAVAERIRQAVANHDFSVRLGIGPGRVTICAGVATYPEHAVKPDELIFRADEAMYAGKHGGRNRVSLYVPAAPASGAGLA